MQMRKLIGWKDPTVTRRRSMLWQLERVVAKRWTSEQVRLFQWSQRLAMSQVWMELLRVEFDPFRRQRSLRRDVVEERARLILISPEFVLNPVLPYHHLLHPLFLPFDRHFHFPRRLVLRIQCIQ